MIIFFSFFLYFLLTYFEIKNEYIFVHCFIAWMQLKAAAISFSLSRDCVLSLFWFKKEFLLHNFLSCKIYFASVKLNVKQHFFNVHARKLRHSILCRMNRLRTPRPAWSRNIKTHPFYSFAFLTSCNSMTRIKCMAPWLHISPEARNNYL